MQKSGRAPSVLIGVPLDRRAIGAWIRAQVALSWRTRQALEVRGRFSFLQELCARFGRWQLELWLGCVGHVTFRAPGILLELQGIVACVLESSLACVSPPSWQSCGAW